jgi:hypothetical protein
MKRREFFQSTAAAAAASVLPAAAAAATTPAQGTAPPLDAEVTRVRVGYWRTADLREANRLAREAGKPLRRPDPPDDENNYWAEAIRIGNSYFYRVGDIVVPATEYEYQKVIANPNMYYFSSALKLHCRIQRKRDGLPEPV